MEVKQLNAEMTELNEINNQCVDMIGEDKVAKALVLLKKAEGTLEVLFLYY
jgi:hypothetical protein